MEGDKLKDSKRSFTLIFEEDGEKIKYGRYISKTPSGAVKKSFNKVKNILKKSLLNKEIILCLKETTQNSKKKEYFYEVRRVKKKKPITYKIGNKTIKKEYDIKVKRVIN